MRISDWSSDVCSSDLRERASVAGVRDVQSLDGRHGAVGEAPGGAGIQIGSGRGEGADRGGQGFGQEGRRAGDGGAAARLFRGPADGRSEEHTSELQSLMRISYAVFCLKKKKKKYD